MITELCQKNLYRLSDETSKIECYFFTATGFPLKLGCKLVKCNMISVAVIHVIIFLPVNSPASCSLHFWTECYTPRQDMNIQVYCPN